MGGRSEEEEACANAGTAGNLKIESSWHKMRRQRRMAHAETYEAG